MPRPPPPRGFQPETWAATALTCRDASCRERYVRLGSRMGAIGLHAHSSRGWLGLATGSLRGLRPAVGVCGELGMGAGGLVGLHAGVQDAIQPSRKKFAARVSI